MADSLTCRCKTFMQAKLEVSMDWDWHDWSIWSGGSSAGFSPTILSYSPVVPFSVRNHNEKLAKDCTSLSVVVAENSVCLIFFPANNSACHLIVALAVYEGLFDHTKGIQQAHCAWEASNHTCSWKYVSQGKILRNRRERPTLFKGVLCRSMLEICHLQVSSSPNWALIEFVLAIFFQGLGSIKSLEGLDLCQKISNRAESTPLKIGVLLGIISFPRQSCR